MLVLRITRLGSVQYVIEFESTVLLRCPVLEIEIILMVPRGELFHEFPRKIRNHLRRTRALLASISEHCVIGVSDGETLTTSTGSEV